jgi:hypothetical protein
MRLGPCVLLIARFSLAGATAAEAQHPEPIPVARPLQFESWSAASPVEVSHKLTAGGLGLYSRNRTHNALLGGVIGAAAGVALCTAFSTAIDDSAEGGLSFCPLDTNLLMGGAGFVLGALIGWAL